MKKLVTNIISITSLYICCNDDSVNRKLVFSEETIKELTLKILPSNALVYYHSGDCSFCYATLLSISEEFPNIPLISISPSSNKALIKFHLEQIGFKGISIYDSSEVFIESNHYLLKENNLFLIDSQFNILISGLNVEKKVFRKIRHQVNRR